MKYLLIAAILFGATACTQQSDTLYLGVKCVYSKDKCRG